VVIDIGAHIGAFSVLAAAEGARRVLAYEPAADNFRLLTINASPFPAIEAHRAAVWRSDPCDASIGWRPSGNVANTGGGTVIACTSVAGATLDAGTPQVVETIALDAILEREGTVGLIKIDAEGSEYPILATSRRLDRVEAIIGEYHAVGGLDPSMEVPGLAEWTGDALMDLLEDRGFEVETNELDRSGLFRARRRRDAG
jgi:FkbM family methyltransferase